MQNKKQAIIIVTIAVVLFVATAFTFLYKSTKHNTTQDKQYSAEISKKYEDLQNQFAVNLPCGVTDFDSPYVSPVQCDTEDVQGGQPIKIKANGAVYDEDGKPLDTVAITVNGGEPFFTNMNGDFEHDIEVDSKKKSINLVANKAGYSPVRTIFNAETISDDGTEIKIPKEYNLGFTMRKIEVQNIQLKENADTVVVSKKYPGVSVTIPANGLKNAIGEIVTGEIIGEITYLNPNDPKDVKFVPGFEGNSKQMIGVNRNGEQVMLESSGMVFFQFKKKGTDGILQPRPGTVVTITQPILDEEYKTLTSQEATLTEEYLKNAAELDKKLGLYEGMNEDERFRILLENDLLSNKEYWYFNKQTGLWEDWPVKYFRPDLEKKIYVMKVSRLY